MVIELPPHQPETTQCRGSLPPAMRTPGFREDPAQRCCDPGDAPGTAAPPEPRRLFPRHPQELESLLGGDAGDGVRCPNAHRGISHRKPEQHGKGPGELSEPAASLHPSGDVSNLCLQPDCGMTAFFGSSLSLVQQTQWERDA